MPPYTTRSAGRSATSGSRLFIRQRSAASCCHPLQRNWFPRGARIVGVIVVVKIVTCPQPVRFETDSDPEPASTKGFLYLTIAPEGFLRPAAQVNSAFPDPPPA